MLQQKYEVMSARLHAATQTFARSGAICATDQQCRR